MAILTSLIGSFSRSRPYPKGNPALAEQEPMWSELGGTLVRAGVGIDDNTATTITAIWRSLKLIASTIGGLPLHVFEKQDDGSRKQVSYVDDKVLWDQPNPEDTNATFWETLVGHEVLGGNAYIWVDADAKSVPISLWALRPERFAVGRDDDGRKVYTIDGNTDNPNTDFSEGGNIIHVRGFGRDGLTGINPIRHMANVLGLSKAAEEYAALLFSQGTSLGGVLSTDQTISQAEAQELSRRWDAAHRGLAKAHRTAVVDRGLKWQQTAINAEDAQMVTTRQHQVAEAGRLMGTPEFLIGSHDKTSSWGSGLEINLRAFQMFTLQEHLVRFEQAITRHLLRGKRYVKFNTNGLLRGTASERMNYYERGQRIGIFSTNDIRALEEMPSLGPEGDARFIPLNMGRLDAMAPQDEPVPQVE